MDASKNTKWEIFYGKVFIEMIRLFIILYLFISIKDLMAKDAAEEILEVISSVDRSVRAFSSLFDQSRDINDAGTS